MEYQGGDFVCVGGSGGGSGGGEGQEVEYQFISGI